MCAQIHILVLYESVILCHTAVHQKENLAPGFALDDRCEMVPMATFLSISSRLPLAIFYYFSFSPCIPIPVTSISHPYLCPFCIPLISISVWSIVTPAYLFLSSLSAGNFPFTILTFRVPKTFPTQHLTGPDTEAATPRLRHRRNLFPLPEQQKSFSTEM
jgi:hypothetical protein